MKRWEHPGTDEVDAVISMSIDEYLSSRFRPDMDYYDGAARERNRAFRSHAEALAHVGGELELQAALCGYHALMSCRIRVSPEAVLVPDLCLVRNDALREDVLITPPLLCVEILDEADTFRTMHQRVALFRSMGVKHVWLIGESGEIVYVASERGFDHIQDGSLHLPEAGVRVSLGDLFAELKED